MSNYHPSYVDDVPVKISERYKPPPEISLPNRLVQCLHKCSKSDDSTSYDFGLEKKILCKTLEWKNIQIKEKNERQERIRLRDQERLRKIEAEHKQKLNQVSYPSTDDLNSMSDEENEATTQKTEPRIQKQQNFNSILVPTVILRDSPVTVPGNPNGFKKTHQKKHSSGKIDYSYFENSNSNPFDNMEMKTINDLDILAEIWKPTVKADANNLERDNSSESDSDKTVNNNSRKQEQPINYPVQSQPQQNYGNFYNYPGNFQQAGQYNYYQQPNYQQFYPNSNQSQTYAPQFTYPSNYQQNINNNTIISDNSINKDVYSYASPYYQQMAPPKLKHEQISQNKSKSVPDIVKELNDELNNCEKRRVRNNSQTVQARKDDANPMQSKASLSVSNKSNELERDFSKLPISSQKLIKKISSMGFELELVSRCAQKIGNDEKNIIEHLIPLGELLDMGFEESTVSDALIKFNNNKDKALDYLIS